MDELDRLKKLAGVNNFKGLVEYSIDQGSNISITGTEKAQIQREKNIKPGDKEWFELWFSRPYWLGFPEQFRGRK